MRSNVLKVLESSAGFYIGTTYKEPVYDPNGHGLPNTYMELPYSRVSGYYPTHKDAETALNGNTYVKREHP
jgi:hypothetical protein